jgi:hypothetical protein
MGTGIIIENNIANTCSSIWQKAPSLPELSMDLGKYNKGFVNFVSLVGAYSLVKSSIWGTKKLLELAKPSPKLPTS